MSESSNVLAFKRPSRDAFDGLRDGDMIEAWRCFTCDSPTMLLCWAGGVYCAECGDRQKPLSWAAREDDCGCADLAVPATVASRRDAGEEDR